MRRKGVGGKRCGADPEPECAGIVKPHAALQPFVALPDELAEGQGVEDLVADDEERLVGQGVHRGVPCEDRSAVPQRFLLDGGETGACLDEGKIGFGGEFRCDPADGADHVLHQRAAAGADFGNRHGERFSGRLPCLDQPNGDQFAEHLADFRRGDEVARDAERIARDVVAMQRMAERERHVARDGDRPFALDQRADFLLEDVHNRSLMPGLDPGIQSASIAG